VKKGSVIAVDPGYDRDGIAVFDGDILTHSECFVPETKDYAERLAAIHEHVRALFKKFQPDSLALETLFFSKNAKTAFKVAEARGVILVTAAEIGIPVFEYSPQEVKIAVTGVGNADKKAVISMVERLLTLPKQKRLDDEYDAIALGIAHQAQSRWGL
jgi:crossover junction endodeoxyribonuclease RuvC